LQKEEQGKPAVLESFGRELWQRPTYADKQTTYGYTHISMEQRPEMLRKEI